MAARRLILAVLAAALPGCTLGGGAYRIGKPSCDSDALQWWDDPARWVAEADAHGDFDVSTGWLAKANVVGSWSDLTQRYEERWTYGDDHYLETQTVRGTLELFRGGDFRLEADEDFEDVLGDEWSREVQMARVGCHESSRFTSDDSVTEITRELGDGTVEEERLTTYPGLPDLFLVTGAYHDDGTGEFEVLVVGADYEFEGEWEPDWHAETHVVDYEGALGDADYAYREELATNGSQEVELSYEAPDLAYEMSYEVDYEGDGKGTLTYDDGTECALRFRDHERECDCGAGFEPC